MNSISKRNHAKIIINFSVNFFMVVFKLLSLLRWSNPNVDFVIKSLCVVFFFLHLILHFNLFKESMQCCLKKKADKMLVLKFSITIILVIIWGISIVASFLVLANYSAEGIVTNYVRFHRVFARIALSLSVISIAIIFFNNISKNKKRRYLCEF